MVTDPISARAPVNIGDVLAGKYRVDGVLGVGGMGVVVAATHLQLGQRVAIKFLLPEAFRLAASLERFSREARAAAQLKSDNVARVIDVATLENGAPYMVMELLEGLDLGDVIQQRGPLPVRDAVDFVVQACDAIAEAHALGIVHRDLKPRNLFLTRRRNGAPLVKVLDFGISKVGSGTPADHSLTKTSDVMGSPNYMAPEQIRSARNVDERTDIWALGVILYELLSGHVPFLAETMPQLCSMVLEQQPPPLVSIRPDVPVQIVRVVERCLAKDPAARFANVGELVASLVPGAVLPPPRAMAFNGGSTPVSPLAQSSAVVKSAGGTSVTFGQSSNLEPKRRSGGAIVGVSVALFVVVCVAAVFGWQRYASHATASAPPTASPLASANSVAPLASTSAAPLASIVATPSASTPFASASTGHPAAAHAPQAGGAGAPKGSAAATAKPTAASGDQFLPDERK